MAGCEAQREAQGQPCRPGVTGEGKSERVNVSEPVVMPSCVNLPGRSVVVGMTRSGLCEIGRRRPRTDLQWTSNLLPPDRLRRFLEAFRVEIHYDIRTSRATVKAEISGKTIQLLAQHIRR